MNDGLKNLLVTTLTHRASALGSQAIGIYETGVTVGNLLKCLHGSDKTEILPFRLNRVFRRGV